MRLLCWPFLNEEQHLVRKMHQSLAGLHTLPGSYLHLHPGLLHYTHHKHTLHITYVFQLT